MTDAKLVQDLQELATRRTLSHRIRKICMQAADRLHDQEEYIVRAHVAETEADKWERDFLDTFSNYAALEKAFGKFLLANGFGCKGCAFEDDNECPHRSGMCSREECWTFHIEEETNE